MQQPETGPYKLRQTLYHGGDILTMEGDAPVYAEALVQREGKIIFAGSKADALAKYKGKANAVDLQSSTLVPGFVDAHCHFSGFGAQAVTANLLASPDGTFDDMEQLVASLMQWRATNGTDLTAGCIVGVGYDVAVLAEKRGCHHRLIIGGVRVTIDGSPQVRTA